jgi:hypothetical protein
MPIDGKLRIGYSAAMFRRSDVNQRLPRYKELITSFGAMAKQGGLEGVPEYVTRQVERAQPVGLNSKGRVVFPFNYRAENGPAVLVQLPNETPLKCVVPASRNLQRSARTIIAKSGISDAPPADFFAERLVQQQGEGWVAVEEFTVQPPQEQRKPYVLGLPRLMCITQQVPERLLGPALAHEADHWDFYMNALPAIQAANPEQPYTDRHVDVIAEKRAYAVSRSIERNLGRYANLQSVSQTAELLRGIEPQEAHLITVHAHEQRAGEEVNDYNTPFAIGVAACLFGDENRLATDQEVTAFKAIGAI